MKKEENLSTISHEQMSDNKLADLIGTQYVYNIYKKMGYSDEKALLRSGMKKLIGERKK